MREEVEGFHLLDCPAFAGGAEEAETVAVLIPVNDLVDAGLFQFVGQGGLAGIDGAARQNVTAGEGHATFLARGAEREGQFAQAARWADEVIHSALRDPTFGFGRFEVERGDRFDWVAVG